MQEFLHELEYLEIENPSFYGTGVCTCIAVPSYTSSTVKRIFKNT